MPAASQRARSSVEAPAVNAMIGGALAPQAAWIWRVASSPSMSGMFTSIRMAPNRNPAALAWATASTTCRPSVAVRMS